VDDSEQFAEFVRGCSRRLQRTAWLLTGDWSGAEDLTQTALAKCWVRWSRVRRADNAEAYARRVLVTTFLGWRRRRWTGELAVSYLPESPAPGDDFGAADLRDALMAALRRLPPRQRAVVALRYFEDLTEAQTAAALGCSVGTVKSQAARALTTLRAASGLRAAVRGEAG
jgi:RNA polymerase sigma-70 factor (sigma-E family)